MNLKWGIFLICLLISCKQEKKEQNNPDATVIITGNIKNRQVYPQQHALKIIIPSFTNSQTIQECEIKDDNTFSFRIQPFALRDIAIETFIPYILIRPGDSLHIELDFGDLTKVTFSGTAAKLNQDLYAFTDGGGYYLKQNSGTMDKMMGSAEFKQKMKQELFLRMDRCKEFTRKYQIEPDLEKWITIGMNAEYYSLLLEYSLDYPLIHRQSLPDSYFDFIPQMESLFTAEVTHSELFELASNFEHMKSKARVAKKPENLEKLTENKILAQFVVASVFDGDLSCNEVDFFEGNRNYFDQKLTLPVLREPLLQKYRDKKNYLANPRPKSDMMLYGVSQENRISPILEEGMKKLQDIIRNNKGKVVLINFWSGCPAAISELQALDSLVDQYKGKEVEFVSIASDSPFMRNKAKKSNLRGQSYFWQNENINQIMRNWHVTWSPYYLLINKDGVIVDYGSHIRPSFSRTARKIDRLLE